MLLLLKLHHVHQIQEEKGVIIELVPTIRKIEKEEEK